MRTSKRCARNSISRPRNPQVTPIPRRSLRRLPDSAWLAKPPPGFARYRSWADAFDTVDAWPLAVARQRWAKDFGDGAQVAWYNRVAAFAGLI